jgi:hypothetical protein
MTSFVSLKRNYSLPLYYVIRLWPKNVSVSVNQGEFTYITETISSVDQTMSYADASKVIAVWPNIEWLFRNKTILFE